LGKLTYDSTREVLVDDRVLAHLQMVIGAKLRRNESFYFTLMQGATAEESRLTLWLHPTISLAFDYDEPGTPSLNRAWVEVLVEAANGGSGLHLVPEPNISPRDR